MARSTRGAIMVSGLTGYTQPTTDKSPSTVQKPQSTDFTFNTPGMRMFRAARDNQKLAGYLTDYKPINLLKMK